MSADRSIRTAKDPAVVVAHPGGAVRTNPSAKEPGPDGNQGTRPRHPSHKNRSTQDPHVDHRAVSRLLLLRWRRNHSGRGCVPCLRWIGDLPMTALLDAAVATAAVPEPFLNSLRYGFRGDVCRLGGLSVVMAGNGDCTEDPASEVDAWARVCELRNLIRNYIVAQSVTPGRVEWRVALPERVAALAWEDGAYQIVCVPSEDAPATAPRSRRHLSVVGS